MVNHFVLVGNPNCGKTTLFNSLTGAHQTTGNWPGVTVEKKEGKISSTNDTLIDLPGLYSLNPYGLEETLTRDFLLAHPESIILNVVDGNAIERSLFLTLQLIELHHPMIILINMMDELPKNGIHVNLEILEQSLGLPVLGISARQKGRVLPLIHQAMQQNLVIPNGLANHGYFSADTKKVLAQLKHFLPDPHKSSPEVLFWMTQLLEQNVLLESQLTLENKVICKTIRIDYEKGSSTEDSVMRLAGERYAFIEKLVKSAVTYGLLKNSASWSSTLDQFATSPIFAYPIFLLVMSLVFFASFGDFSSFLSDQISSFLLDFLSPLVVGFIEQQGVSPWVISFVRDALFEGVGSVISFLPQIGLLFFFLSILEDTGYLSRVAFVLDKLLRRLGMSGRAIVPLIMGFGCTVTAVTTTRSIENTDERKMAILLTPFMSCSAKLPVYVLIAGLFFPSHQGIVVYGLYLLGIVVAILYGWVLRKLFFRKSRSVFLIEMPPYRFPYFPNVFHRAFINIRDFITRAGTLIFVMTIIIWTLTSFSLNGAFNQTPDTSLMAYVGKGIAPLFAPLGFGEWRAAVALLMGLVAKEVVVSSIQTLYSVEVFSSLFTVASALSFVVFTALYIPCFSAIASMARELSSKRWVAVAIIGQLLVAYGVSWMIYMGVSLWPF